jgi:hypothetical protein
MVSNALAYFSISVDDKKKFFDVCSGLEYVCLIQEVQERKKFEFVEIVSARTYLTKPVIV